LERLSDLTYEEEKIALAKTSEYLTCNKGARQADGVIFVEKGRGPRIRSELADDELASYNGVGGGRFFKWYQPGLFETELKALGAGLEGCTERECVVALRNVSARIRMWSPEDRVDLAPYAGPQCYPHLKDAARYLATGVYEQGQRQGRRLAIETEALAASGLPKHLDSCLPDQLTDCWLRCGKCKAWRLVDKWSMAALTSEAYGKSEAGVAPDPWQSWVCTAGKRFEAWQRGRERNFK
jgi:hypothetical protein